MNTFDTVEELARLGDAAAEAGRWAESADYASQCIDLIEGSDDYPEEYREGSLVALKTIFAISILSAAKAEREETGKAA